MRALGLSLGIFVAVLAVAPVQAQVDAEVIGSTTVAGPETDSALRHWWLGAYFRHLEVPGYMTDPFFDRAPAVSNNGFGLVATYRTGGGLNVVMGVGYMPYEFAGPFLADGQPVADTELVRSDLEFIHLEGALLWDIEFHPVIALEIGFGLDFGLLAGDIRRNEAFLDASGRFRNCNGPLDPAFTPPGSDKPYCAVPENGSGVTDDAADEGEHYHITEDRVPPVMPFLSIPQIALRIQPLKHLALKLEGGFGVVQWWVGASLHASFGMFESSATETIVEPEAAPEVVTGRVLGKVVEADTGIAVAGAIVRQAVRAMSPIATESDGLFVIDRLPVGTTVTFEVEHADYAKGSCAVEIPESGADVAVQCRLTPKVRVGAISGQVHDEKDQPISGATIELTGAQTATLTSDDRGLFAAGDLPPGSYRLRVVAEGYLVQMVDIEVAPLETAMPKIVLIKQPAKSLVKLGKEEIVITEQVQFKSGSSEILADSDDLLSQVADVLLRHMNIERVEVQGHTDSKGTHDFNMKLSQARAEAVRAWLTGRGVSGERLQAVGYGPDQPIRPNDTPANRQKNRRVQFMIRQQAGEGSE